LAKPLETCSLIVERVEDVCVLKFMAWKPKPNAPKGAKEAQLYCQCDLDLRKEQSLLKHYCESVLDSSRYFVVKIVDPKNRRTAHVGVGFRERNDATDFRMALQEYEKSLKRERTAQQLRKAATDGTGQDASTTDAAASAADSSKSTESGMMSKLSLGEGETIHVDLKGGGSSRVQQSKPKGGTKSGGGPILLKKPPPPAGALENPIFHISLEDMEEPRASSFRASGGGALSVDSGDAILDEEDWNDYESVAAAAEYKPSK